jgi:predicted membrane-bound spermidine synthase
MFWYFVFFLLSGFCGILYEVIWMRLAMAQFGVTTALVSIVLSAFMAGLGAGSWAAGVLLRRHQARIDFPPLRLYAVAELLIAVSAYLVTLQLTWGHLLLQHIVEKVAVSSPTYYLASGTWLTLTLVPWCACMGATIPLAMFAISRDSRYETRRSFSFLYLANVLGAVAGTMIPLLFIEVFGFRSTLKIGAMLNITIATLALFLTLSTRQRSASTKLTQMPEGPSTFLGGKHNVLVLLFTTGLTTMGMEVVWIRLFTPYVGPLVYSFAAILASYLLATFVGSQFYRFWSRRTQEREGALAWISLGLLGLLPLLTSDPRLSMRSSLRVFAGVAPFAAVVGFLTPMLVDRFSAGAPDRAGRAYAVNVFGCIVGPLVSGFLLLPLVGERVAMLLFVVPCFAIAALLGKVGKSWIAQRVAMFGTVVAGVAVFVLTKDFETRFPERTVLRDSAATVMATGTGRGKQLLVNGVGMTGLSPITKMMTHFTLASLQRPSRETLVICFGMGTTFRSAVSWGTPTTAVDLIPSVPKLFTYFFPDGADVLASPFAHVVVDDGRRYLERTPQSFDAIMIDPPPPVSAAGSSLLYSQDFYELVKQHLTPDGILQQWLPEGDDAVVASVARALQNSFPHVRVFNSVEHWGWHFLASTRPIPNRDGAEMVAKMPGSAITDMMEWGPAETPVRQFELMLSKKVSLDQLIRVSPETPALQDDRPINEYFRLRTSCQSCPPRVDHIRRLLYSGLRSLAEKGAPTIGR